MDGLRWQVGNLQCRISGISPALLALAGEVMRSGAMDLFHSFRGELDLLWLNLDRVKKSIIQCFTVTRAFSKCTLGFEDL